MSRQSWQTRRTADILRVSAKVSLRAAARTRTDTGRAVLVIRRMADSAAPLFQRLPPHAQAVPADCDSVSGEWVRTGTGLDESKVVLIFHSGGYFSLSAAAVRPLTWRLSEAVRCPVLATDYALAPENDLPAARADALTTYRWLLAGDFRPEDLTLAGDSTGGHLALATLLAVRDESLPLPGAIVAISPWTDLTPDGPRHCGNVGIDAFFPPRFLPWLARCYTRACDPSDPLISPVNGDYAGTPPMMLVCSDAEALRDDARRVAERARDAGCGCATTNGQARFTTSLRSRVSSRKVARRTPGSASSCSRPAAHEDGRREAASSPAPRAVGSPGPGSARTLATPARLEEAGNPDALRELAGLLGGTWRIEIADPAGPHHPIRVALMSRCR